MSKQSRVIAMLVVLSLLLSMVVVFPASAAVPDRVDISAVTGSAGQAAAIIEAGITAGYQDVDGVYYDVSYPESITVGTYEIGSEDYILMAAQAIGYIANGKAEGQSVSYEDISLVRTDSMNGAGTNMTRGQYVELADRVTRYGTAQHQLPGSFNRPTDGINVYEGRITLYSIGHLFAKVLAAYESTKTLPDTVVFLPVHMGDVEVTPTEPAPTAPDDWFAAVIDASVEVKASMVDKNVLPGTIYVGPIAVTPAQYVYLASSVVYALGNGTTSGDLTVPELNEPEHPQGATTGRIYEADFTDMARRTAQFCIDYGQPPNYTSSSDLGAVHYYAVIETMARVLAYYKNNSNDIPNYITLSGFSGAVEDVTTPTTTPTTVPTTAPTSAPTTPSGSSSSSSAVVTDDWYANVVSAAIAVESYVKEKGVLPSTITVGTTNCTYAQFTYLACQVILGINNGQTSGELSVPSTTEPANPSETLQAGTFTKTEILDLAGRSIKFMDNNGGLAANYMNSSLGQMHHHGALYLYARVLSYYAANGKLPDSMAVTSWAATMASVPGAATFGNDFSAYASFLVPTANCPSTNATIISIGKTAMYYSKGAQGGFEDPKTTYEAMFNLMEYINDMTSYQYYLNTSRGALKTWADKRGNCCDMAHLVNACARSLGVPGRYAHWDTGVGGHVWASLYCPDAPNPNINKENGWIYADPVREENYLGYQSFALYSEYGNSRRAELPF